MEPIYNYCSFNETFSKFWDKMISLSVCLCRNFFQNWKYCNFGVRLYMINLYHWYSACLSIEMIKANRKPNFLGIVCYSLISSFFIHIFRDRKYITIFVVTPTTIISPSGLSIPLIQDQVREADSPWHKSCPEPWLWPFWSGR